jgi:type IV pilus assembly protein PilO
VGPLRDLAASKDGMLSMEATAKTFRYLDADEVAAQRKATEGAKK